MLHLTPLTRDDVLQILQSRLVETEPMAFLSDTHERGLSGLLTNPLTLDMLIEPGQPVERDFPKVGAPPLRSSGALLAEEQNGDHQIISQDEDTEAVLDVAGRLNAVQLLTGMSGYTTGYEEGDEGYLKLGTDRI